MHMLFHSYIVILKIYFCFAARMQLFILRCFTPADMSVTNLAYKLAQHVADKLFVSDVSDGFVGQIFCRQIGRHTLPIY